jgi:ribonucleoside-diphosphate reductase beta chain
MAMSGQYCTKLICVEKKPEERWRLFFGDNGNFLRIDRCDYPVFQNLYEKAFSDFWTHKVVDFSKDVIGWDSLDEKAKRMFLLNNGYQALMDSGVTSVFSYFAEVCTNTELKVLYKYNDQNESIHAISYSYGLSQMFGGKAEEKLDIVYSDPIIKKRMDDEISYSDEFIKYVVYEKNTDDKAKELLLKEMIVTYMLEHIKFPFSFFVTWRINEGNNNAIQGFSQLLKLIAHDELTTHTVTHINVFKILRKEERQGFQHIIEKSLDFIYDYAKHVAEEEIKWNEYLFAEGDINGFTKSMGEHFIKYYTDKALTDLGLEKIYNEDKSDVIDWYERYRNINLQNSALQEVSNTMYQKGVTKNDLGRFDTEFK